MVGIAFAFDWETYLVLFWLCMFMFTFSLGLGPVTFVVASEVGFGHEAPRRVAGVNVAAATWKILRKNGGCLLAGGAHVTVQGNAPIFISGYKW